MTSSSTIPTPPGNCSNRLMGNGLVISKKRKSKKLQKRTVHRKGARKFPTRKPTISSMTMICGSFCPKIAAPRVDDQIAHSTDTTTIALASGNFSAANRLSAIESGTATRVPAVPGRRGIYPAPAPVTQNSTALRQTVFISPTLHDPPAQTLLPESPPRRRWFLHRSSSRAEFAPAAYRSWSKDRA